MKFIDTINAIFLSGDGGDGCSSWNKESYNSRSKCDGGNGGNGGNIVFISDKNINSFNHMSSISLFVADNGQNGSKQNRTGKNGLDKIIKIPIETHVYDINNNLLFHFNSDNQIEILCLGGRGGIGNAKWKNFKQYNNLSIGIKGDSKEFKLILKLKSNVCLIGFPNSGKSSLLSIITSSLPIIDKYLFTTKSIIIGTRNKIQKNSLVVIETPGIILKSHIGRGVGLNFLKHVIKTNLICHLIESSFENLNDSFVNSYINKYKIVRKEMYNYNKSLLLLPEIIVISKCDLLFINNILSLKKLDLFFKNKFNKHLLYISSDFNIGIKNLINNIMKHISK